MGRKKVDVVVMTMLVIVSIIILTNDNLSAGGAETELGSLFLPSIVAGFIIAFSLFQREVADAVDIPVYISSLIQIPMVSQSLGVVVANSDALSTEHLYAVGAENIPIVLAGMQHQPQFTDVIFQGNSVLTYPFMTPPV